MKQFVKREMKPYRGFLDDVPAKLKICSLALAVMVFAELFVNNAAISRLLDSDMSVAGIFRSGVVALFLTVLIVVLGVYGGDRAKRFYHSVTIRSKSDGSQLAIALICGFMNVILIACITYIRYQVGAMGDEPDGDVFAQTAYSVSGASVSASGFSVPEVVLLAVILFAAAVFSFIVAFVSTDPIDGDKQRALCLVGLEVGKALADASSERSEEFSANSLRLIEHHCDAVRWRARDQLVVALCNLASDPAIATRLARNPPAAIRPDSPQEGRTRDDIRKLG